MNDHNLDDLIIDTIEPKNNKGKSLLTIIALFIIVLIVAIILTKTLLKSPENPELVFEENISEMISPELKLQETPQEVTVAKPTDEPTLPTIIEEKIEAPREIKESEAPKIVEKKSTPKHLDKTVILKEEEVITQPHISKPIIKKIPKQIITKKPKTAVKKPTVKAVKNLTVPPKTSKIPQTTTQGTYYVQVGSFKENPSKRFLSVIKSSGFNYHITSPDRTGYKKLLIGPYKTRAAVDKARDVVRDRIHKSAFVVQK